MIALVGFILIFTLLAVALIRNSLVLKARLKQIDIIHKSGGDYRDFDRLSYEKMLFSFSKWTHSQFYK